MRDIAAIGTIPTQVVAARIGDTMNIIIITATMVAAHLTKIETLVEIESIITPVSVFSLDKMSPVLLLSKNSTSFDTMHLKKSDRRFKAMVYDIILKT